MLKKVVLVAVIVLLVFSAVSVSAQDTPAHCTEQAGTIFQQLYQYVVCTQTDTLQPQTGAVEQPISRVLMILQQVFETLIWTKGEGTLHGIEIPHFR